MRTMNDVSLLDIIPPSLLQDERMAVAAVVLDKKFREINANIQKLTLLSSIDELNNTWLDELAWQLHLDFYNRSLPIEKKRELIQMSDAWHKRKGTPSAVEELITAIFGDGRVEEWFEFGGAPFTFRVITTNPSATNEQANEFITALNSVKNARSRLESIQISLTDEMGLYFGGVLYMGEFMTVKQVI